MVIGMIKDSQGMDEMKNPCLVLYVNLTEAISTDGLLLTDICKISFNGLLRKKHWLPPEIRFLPSGDGFPYPVP